MLLKVNVAHLHCMLTLLHKEILGEVQQCDVCVEVALLNYLLRVAEVWIKIDGGNLKKHNQRVTESPMTEWPC